MFGVHISNHAVDQWCKRKGKSIYQLQYCLREALKESCLPMYYYRGTSKLRYNGYTFVLYNTTLVTCY